MSDPQTDAKAASDPRSVYQVFMLVLCVMALAGIVLQNVFRLDPEIETILDYADSLICIAFAADFMLSLIRADNRLRYLLTWGWLDFLSSIPTLDVARWGRLARIARISRVLRGVRATRLLTGVILRKRSQSTFVAAALNDYHGRLRRPLPGQHGRPDRGSDSDDRRRGALRRIFGRTCGVVPDSRRSGDGCGDRRASRGSGRYAQITRRIGALANVSKCKRFVIGRPSNIAFVSVQ